MKQEYENNIHFIAISVILLTLSIKYWYFLIVLFLYLIFIYRKTKLLKPIVIILILVSLSSLRYLVKIDEDKVKGIVFDFENEKYKVLTQYGFIYIDGNMNVGDIGEFEISKNKSSMVTAFDYQDYRLSKSIIGSYSLTKSNVSTNIFVPSKIHHYLVSDFEEDNVLKDYINSFIFGKNTLEDELNSNTKKIGISHILAMSGLHVTILVSMLMLLVDKIFIHSKPKEIVKSVILITILIITNFNTSVTRTVLMMVLEIIVKRKRSLFTSLDIWSLTLIITLLINPRSIYLSGYLLSYISTFTLIMMKDLKARGFKKIILTSLIIMIVTAPIIINMNYEINLISFIVSPLISLYFEFILFPLTIISLLFLPIAKFLVIFFDLFNYLVEVISRFDLLVIKLKKLNVILIVLYYIFLYLFIVKKKTRYALSILLIILIPNCFKYVNPTLKVTMYNVGQGDSLLVTTPYSKSNILIDSFGDIKNILRSDSITSIDYLFLTHGDNDHISAFADIYEEYHPSHIYTTAYTCSDSLVILEETYNFKYLKHGDKIVIDGVTFDILSPNTTSENENDNSLVMKLTYQTFSVLFTGDIEREDRLINEYQNELKSNILKASHHGSKTSSSKALLDYVNPDYVLVSVGTNNYYGHPNNSYLLNNYNCLRTDKSGTVSISYYKGKYIINKQEYLWYTIVS